VVIPNANSIEIEEKQPRFISFNCSTAQA
jgi:hypothetical protein